MAAGNVLRLVSATSDVCDEFERIKSSHTFKHSFLRRRWISHATSLPCCLGARDQCGAVSDYQRAIILKIGKMNALGKPTGNRRENDPSIGSIV